jgi:hypothetical protein
MLRRNLGLAGYARRRGQVSGGGKKPYRQKGNGRARQGSLRAPQYAGGGTGSRRPRVSCGSTRPGRDPNGAERTARSAPSGWRIAFQVRIAERSGIPPVRARRSGGPSRTKSGPRTLRPGPAANVPLTTA